MEASLDVLTYFTCCRGTMLHVYITNTVNMKEFDVPEAMVSASPSDS